MKKSLIACAFAFSSLPLVAHAQPVDGWGRLESLDVFYGDLNLSNPAGAEVILNRINFAATRVCGGLPDIRELRERTQFKACVRVATEEAISEVNAPLVSALYDDDMSRQRWAYAKPVR